MKDYMTIYKEWLENPYFDEATKEELRAIEGDENEIKERFYMDLEFGTAGLRGIIGAGINRMNIYTVRTCDPGTGKLHHQAGRRGRKAWRSHYDSRHMSPEFAEEAALYTGGKRHQGLPVRVAAPDAGAFLCRPRAWLHRRHQHHRKPQPAGVQRLQGLLGGRRTVYTAA